MVTGVYPTLREVNPGVMHLPTSLEKIEGDVADVTGIVLSV